MTGRAIVSFTDPIKRGFVLAANVICIAIVGYNKLQKLAENVREALSSISVEENKKVEGYIGNRV